MSYSGHTWTVDGLDPVLLCAVVGEGFEVHGLEVALGALVFDFPVDGVDVVVDRPTELRLEVTKAEIGNTRRVDSLANKLPIRKYKKRQQCSDANSGFFL